MIKPKIINNISNQKGVRPQQIEKDYIISWTLWGIAQNETLCNTLIFKGGTCLKKVHIEDYRYSEDMDFTINPDIENEISNDDIYTAFADVFREIKENSNIILLIPEDSKEIHEQTNSMKFYIDYVGPLGGRGDHIKVDVTRGEQLEFDIKKMPVYNDYPDLKEEDDFTVKCYCLEEVVIEKMAALMGRTVPRDLYDFDYLTDVGGVELQDLFYEFERKAEHKGQDPSKFTACLEGKKQKLERAWEENLSHQIKDISKFKDVWRNIGKQLRKIEKIK